MEKQSQIVVEPLGLEPWFLTSLLSIRIAFQIDEEYDSYSPETSGPTASHLNSRWLQNTENGSKLRFSPVTDDYAPQDMSCHKVQVKLPRSVFGV